MIRTMAVLGLLAIALLLAGGATAWCAVIYVNGASTAELPDGASWETAFPTVQAGINAAGFGYEVWVAEGVYVERISLRVNVYGGFPAEGGSWDTRSPRAHVTVIDGNREGSVVTAPSGSSSILDGFTIRNGKAEFGGGIYAHNSHIRIQNNVIIGNTSRYGGAVSATAQLYRQSYWPRLFNNVIAGNSAIKGGGIYYGTNVHLYIGNNTIVSNYAQEGGGMYVDASYNDDTSLPKIWNNIIAYNSSGIFRLANGKAELRNNCLYDNSDYDYNGLPPGVDDIQMFPALASVAYGDVRIQHYSACVNAGFGGGTGYPPLPSTDAGGNPRVQGGSVDIGAYESDGVTFFAESPVIVRVSPDGEDNNDGSSWAMAKSSVQTAIDLASTQGGEVWVKGSADSYKERIELRPYVYVYGGFSGSETSLSERNWRLNTTILDGQQEGTVVTATLGHFCSSIDGFTIRNGRGRFGGGIYTDNCSLLIMNNNIVGNHAEYWGGGVLSSGGAPVYLNNNITDNTAEFWGGGIALDYDCSALVLNNVIARNTVNRKEGGGIDTWASSAQIISNTIVDNSAADGGGISSTYSDALIANNIVAFGSSGIFAGPDNVALSYNNCLFGNTSYAYDGLSASASDLFVDPLFSNVATGDYHLRWNSLCIDAGSMEVPFLATHDIDGEDRVRGMAVDIGADEYWPITVQVDIKPGEHPNEINLNSRGLLPVAILSTPLFDASEVDPVTVRMAGASVAARGRHGNPITSLEDVDGDGYVDLVLMFGIQSLSLSPGTSTVTLTGMTYGGIEIQGTDTVIVN